MFDTRDQANQLSHDLCRILRHKIGTCRGSTFKCDEGGWVDIDAIITDYEVNLFPPSTSKHKRYMATVDAGYKKSRFQILAASIMNPNDARAARQELLNMAHTQDEVNEIFSRCVGWYRPWCVRATTGHSDFGFMSSSALASRYSARMGDVLADAFHVTYVENLPSIARCGLVPGGIGGGNRLALHFGAFAPWDKMNLVTKTSLRNLRVGDPIAIIYVPSATLARYGAGVAFSGTFMVFDVIPFYETFSLSSWMEQQHCSLQRSLSFLRNYFDQYHLQPKSVVADQAFMTDTWEHFYQSLNITPISLGPNTPWPNRAEAAVRLLKAQLKIMLSSIKAGTAPATLKKVTYRQLVKAAATVRNQTVTYGGVTPLELAFGRRPADLIQLDVATPTQMTIERNEEELTAIQIKQLSKQAFQEARQSEDIRRDLAQNPRMSSKPLQVKDKVFYRQEDNSKIRSDGSKGGIWLKGKVISIEGAMIGLDLGTRLIKVNMTKVRKDETIPPEKQTWN